MFNLEPAKNELPMLERELQEYLMSEERNEKMEEYLNDIRRGLLLASQRYKKLKLEDKVGKEV